MASFFIPFWQKEGAEMENYVNDVIRFLLDDDNFIVEDSEVDEDVDTVSAESDGTLRW